MDILSAKPIIIAHLQANEPIMVSGPPGVGKSDLFRQIAAELYGGNIIDRFRASQMDSTDIKGVPSVNKGRTAWNPPEELPDEKRDGREGIVFFDEINTGNQLVQASMMQLILDRCVGSYVLPNGWRIGAAGNRVSDRAAAQRMGTALANRFAHIDIDPHFPSWREWAVGPGKIMPEIVAFLEWCEARGNSLLHKMPEMDAREFPSPRSWARTSKVCNQNPALAYQIARANVGEAPAVEFKAFLDVYRTLPTMNEIISDPVNARVPLEPSAQFAVASVCSRAATPQTLKSIVTYMKRFPPSFQIMMMTDAVRRDPLLKQAPGFSAWAVDNSQVML